MAEILSLESRAENVEVVIIGGGPVGAALALALKGSGISIRILEARERSASPADERAIALSHGSRLILQRLGAWQCLRKVTAIRAIHVSSRGSFGRAMITPEDAGTPALGYVVSYQDLWSALHTQLTVGGIDCLTGASATRLQPAPEGGSVEFNYRGEPRRLKARLLVIADGGPLVESIAGISQRMRDYGQWAVVAQVESEQPHRHTAFERFTPEGPLALLPQGERLALVWTLPQERAREVLDLDDENFLMRMHGQFGDRLGQFIRATKRAGFPLALKYAVPVISDHLVLVGNAAQLLHPVAGQGFNVGLRDAWELAGEILEAPDDVGSSRTLGRYQSRRRLDRRGGILFTDSLVRLFSNANPVLGPARAAALSLLDCAPSAKAFLARRMIFGTKG